MSKMGLDRSRKFLRVVAKLRLDSPAHVEGHLVQLWKATHEAGNAIAGDLDEIELLAKWPTGIPDRYPPGAFAAAVIDAGLVDEIVPGKLYAIHDWYDHAPEFVKRKIGRAQQGDVSIGPDNYYLGREKFARLLESFGIQSDESEAEPVENGQGDGWEPETSDTVRQNSPLNVTDRGVPSDRQGKGREGKGSISPPSSPPSHPPSDLLPPPDRYRPLTARAVELLEQLRTTSPAAAELLDEEAGDCSTPEDWQRLIDRAERALDQEGLDAPLRAEVASC